MDPLLRVACDRCDQPAADYVDGVPLCEGHWYENANAEAEAEQERWREERLILETAEMDRHFRDHPHA